MVIKKRIGKDLNITWKVSFKGGGQITSAYQSKLKLVVYDPNNVPYELAIKSIDEEGIHAKFEGEIQRKLGLYRMTLWIGIDDADGNTSCVDLLGAFELVKYTTEETSSDVLDMDGDIIVTALELEYGKTGLNAVVTLVNQLKQEVEDFKVTVDTTLTKEGEAADAKRVGDLLRGIENNIGPLDELHTKADDCIVNAINELHHDQVVVDATLSHPGDAADADVVGKRLAIIKEELDTATDNIEDVVYKNVKQDQKLSELEGEVESISPKNTADSDFEISDEKGYTIVRFENGHFVTKNFNSANIAEEVASTKENVESMLPREAGSDFELSDENGYSIAKFNDGHIETKNFNSKEICNTLNINRLKSAYNVELNKQGYVGRDGNFVSGYAGYYVSKSIALSKGDVITYNTDSGGAILCITDTVQSYYVPVFCGNSDYINSYVFYAVEDCHICFGAMRNTSTHPTIITGLYRNGLPDNDVVLFGSSSIQRLCDVTRMQEQFRMEKLLGNCVHNYGVGGENIRAITSRLGSECTRVASSFTIPSGTGKVNIGQYVKVRNENTNYTSQADKFLTMLNPVVINGIHGVITTDDTNLYFNRLSNGTSKTVTEGSLIQTIGTRLRNTILVAQLGNNKGYTDTNDFVSYYEKVLQSMGNSKFVFVSRLVEVGADWTNTSSLIEEENALEEKFGINTFNMRRYMVENGIDDAKKLGLMDSTYPTSVDLEDMSNGYIPTSLRGDGQHLNPIGYNVFSVALTNKIKELYNI